MKLGRPFFLEPLIPRHAVPALLPVPNQSSVISDRCANQQSSPDKAHNQPSRWLSGAFFQLPEVSIQEFQDLFQR